MSPFSFYCWNCSNYLQQKYSIDIADYIIYFQISYRKLIHPDDCAFGSLIAIHSHFQHNLKVTDRPLAQLLEVILLLKVTAYNLEPLSFFKTYIMDKLPEIIVEKIYRLKT